MTSLSFKTVLGRLSSLPALSYTTRVYSGKAQVSFFPSTVKKINSQFTSQYFLTDYRSRHFPLLQPQSLFGRIQRRDFTTQIRAPLSKEEFFDRERETHALKYILSHKPQVSIVSGPVDSGKTTLLLKILEEESNNNRAVLHIDLRASPFHSVNGLATSLEDNMRSWLDRFAEIAKQSNNLNIREYEFSLKVPVSVNDSPLERLNSLFNTMFKQLPPLSWWPAGKSPIIFIDQASRLLEFLKDEKDREALRELIEWFVTNTYHHPHFHVVLGTSDSSLHRWIQEYIRAASSRTKSYEISHLPKDEAEKFWNEKVITRKDFTREKFSPPSFTDAYKVCGGCMYFLTKYASEYIIKEGEMQPEDFFLIGNERRKLINHYFDTNAPWSREQLIEMMKKLVNAKNGFLIYEDLLREMGPKVVNAFIESHILHLRTSPKFAYDLPEEPKGRPIITAMTPSALVVMKNILADEKRKI
ncbi:MAG: hypothetical protein KR126chlam5_00749 [Candidatus Anoxychlamydiales bacterium]|nr:hypothetical protein [Candidatus Anoxychlamydiales bacterium]